MRRFITRRLLVSIVTIAGAMSLPGCNLTTANLSSFVVSKDKERTQSADKFNPQETIYAKTTIYNVRRKITEKWRDVSDHIQDE